MPGSEFKKAPFCQSDDNRSRKRSSGFLINSRATHVAIFKWNDFLPSRKRALKLFGLCRLRFLEKHIKIDKIYVHTSVADFCFILARLETHFRSRAEIIVSSFVSPSNFAQNTFLGADISVKSLILICSDETRVGATKEATKRSQTCDQI